MANVNVIILNVGHKNIILLTSILFFEAFKDFYGIWDIFRDTYDLYNRYRILNCYILDSESIVNINFNVSQIKVRVGKDHQGKDSLVENVYYFNFNVYNGNTMGIYTFKMR